MSTEEDEEDVFGQLVNEIVGLEDTITKFYKDSLARIEDKELHDIIDISLLQDSLQRIEFFKKVASASTKLVKSPLPPIDLELEDFKLRIANVIEDAKRKDLSKVISLEGIMEKFYNQASERIVEASAYVADQLTRYYMESAQRKDKIVNYIEAAKAKRLKEARLAKMKRAKAKLAKAKRHKTKRVRVGRSTTRHRRRR